MPIRTRRINRPTDAVSRESQEKLRLPDESIDTGMPIASRRAGPARKAVKPPQERAKKRPKRPC